MRTFDFRTYIIKLFDLNDDDSKSCFCLPLKEKNHIHLQMIHAGINYDDTHRHEITTNENIIRSFEEKFNVILKLYSVLLKVKFMAIRPQDHTVTRQNMTKNGNIERQMRYSPEDIQFKNRPQTQNIASISVIQQVPLASNVYQDDEQIELISITP
ncbi:unnamed protein product, partial [Rotaria sp. Silwood1]